MKAPIHIVGAGPAGLTAAIVAARGGARAMVHERKGTVGARFHGDFQGIENWTTTCDVLEELARIGIEPGFDHTPFREAVFFDPEGREHVCRSKEPLFYLVRRGPQPGTLDVALQAQARALGGKIRFNHTVSHLPRGGIVAMGPLRAPAIAVGYVFETDAADGAYAVAGDRLAPKGYAYLLVHRGRGTLASCIFANFHQEPAYLERTVDFFRNRVGLAMRNPSRFSGCANSFPLPSAVKGNILYAGESAGFQDALFGFGMRYAMLSGALAATALMDGTARDYDRHWKRRMVGFLRTGLVNRYLYERLGDRGYARFMDRVTRTDGRDFLRGLYAPALWKSLLFQPVRRRMRQRIETPLVMMKDCDCTWCRCDRLAGHAARCAA